MFKPENIRIQSIHVQKIDKHGEIKIGHEGYNVSWGVDKDKKICTADNCKLPFLNKMGGNKNGTAENVLYPILRAAAKEMVGSEYEEYKEYLFEVQYVRDFKELERIDLFKFVTSGYENLTVDVREKEWCQKK